MAEQLTFDLPIRVSRARGDFFVSDANAMALARLENSKTWPNRKLILVGSKGAGKTHLAHVWAEQTGGMLISPKALTNMDIPGINGPVALDPVCDLTPAQEEAVFHLHNHLGSNGLPFLLVARSPAARWAMTLPDLQSRMSATDTVRIDGPDDALLAAVLVKLFADRQLIVAPSVIDWLVRNMDRSFAETQRLVNALDRASLAESRAITRPLAQRILTDTNRT